MIDPAANGLAPPAQSPLATPDDMRNIFAQILAKAARSRPPSQPSQRTPVDVAPPLPLKGKG
jgi:hypothetical protein